MTDPDQPGEELDESVGDDFPPDRPPRLDDDGGTEAEVWETDVPGGGEGVELAGDPDIGLPDDEAELVGSLVDDERDTGSLAPDDEFTGDETTRDVASERAPAAAEDAAVHVEDEPHGTTP
jgi:hypothetical protein